MVVVGVKEIIFSLFLFLPKKKAAKKKISFLSLSPPRHPKGSLSLSL